MIYKHAFSKKITKWSLIVFKLALFSLLITSCSRIDTNWHRYKERNFEVIGTDSRLVDVPSDGWKIIGKADGDRDQYEWGWEITIKINKDPNIPEGLFPSFKEIQYVLFDKDGFELTRDTLPGQFIRFSATTDTFRHTSKIPRTKAMRAAQSSYKVIMY